MGHLELLKEKFPGKIFLNADDIAECMNYSKGHIYNLSSRKELPFTVDRNSDKLQVSIIAMARFLDSEIEKTEPIKEVVKEPSMSVPDMIQKPKPKRGRPRNSSKTQLAFQSQLQIAIMQKEVFNVFQDMQDKIQGMSYPSDEEVACSVKFNEAKNDFSQFASYGEKYLSHAFFELIFGVSIKQKRKKEF